MDARLINRIETNAERLAAALFGAAVAYAAYGLLGAGTVGPESGASMAAAGGIAFMLCRGTLRAVAGRGARFSVRTFDVRELETFEADDELLLTDADRLQDELLLTDADRLTDELLLTAADRLYPAQAGGTAEPLELDDILTEMGPDSRVVRLFDRQAMPTPGQLKSRIDSHIAPSSSQSGSPDASEALSAALAELRRSLR